jgi:hypothetical protein
VWLIVIGQVVRLLPEAAQATRGSLARASPILEEAARSLGRGPLRAFCATTLPIAAGGALAGGLLVFLSVMKEVPATLLLRPAGFDTLAVRVWLDASEGLYRAAAPAALWLVGVCAASLVLALLLMGARAGDRRGSPRLRRGLAGRAPSMPGGAVPPGAGSPGSSPAGAWIPSGGAGQETAITSASSSGSVTGAAHVNRRQT